MKSFYTISLEQVRLFGHHGVHPEESIAGGEFEVNMQVRFHREGKIMALEETVDYTVMYAIVKEVMLQPAALLETVCHDIGERVKHQFPNLEEINITISKINPPVGNFQGHLKVSWNKQF